MSDLVKKKELTENQWQIAHAIARQLVQDGTDLGELKKVFAYLRTCVDKPNAGDRFFTYLQNLERKGNQVGHSGKTIEYYRSINQVCRTHLMKSLKDDPQTMLEVLGWAGRLGPYYKTSPVAEEITGKSERFETKRQGEQQSTTQNSFMPGQTISAIVVDIKGNTVVYQLSDRCSVPQQESKNAKKLKINQTVQVMITGIQNGMPSKVKLLNE